MTGYVSPSEDPDLEDGEIDDSDEESAEKPKEELEKRLPPAREERQPSPPKRDRRESPALRGDRRGESPLHRGDRRGNSPIVRRGDSPQLRRGESPLNRPERRARRTRPQDENEEPDRKRRKGEEIEGEEGEENEDEMLGLCMRGGSPDPATWKAKPAGQMDATWQDDSFEDDKQRGKRNNFRSKRDERDMRNRLPMKRRMKPGQKGVADQDVCLAYLKGSCNKSAAECSFSHNVAQPRKMELCKFFLKDCCVKREKCLYLHEEFPCKFFHTGQKCYSGNKCKFSHDPLTSFSREILLKHMETAPKDILGDFPRMSRENAEAAVDRRGDGEDDRNRGRRRDEGDRSRRDFDDDRKDDRRRRDEDDRRDDREKRKDDADTRGENEDDERRRKDVDERRSRDDEHRRRDNEETRTRDNDDRKGRDDDQKRDSSDVRDDDLRRRDDDEPRRREDGPRNEDVDERRDADIDNRRDDRRRGDRFDDSRDRSPRRDRFHDDDRRSRRNRRDEDDRRRNNRDSPRRRNERTRWSDADGPNNFGPNNQNTQNFCPPNNQNNQNFGPPNNANFGPGPNFPFNNFPFGPNGPNFNPNFNFGPNGPNFGPNGPNFGPDGPNFPPFNMNVPNFPMNMGNMGPNGPMPNGPNFGSNNQEILRNSDLGRSSGDDKRRRGDSEEHTKKPEKRQRRKSENEEPKKNVEEKPTGRESPYDFAKELAEYKSKKMELELQKLKDETDLVSATIEKPPVMFNQPPTDQIGPMFQPPTFLPPSAHPGLGPLGAFPVGAMGPFGQVSSGPKPEEAAQMLGQGGPDESLVKSDQEDPSPSFTQVYPPFPSEAKNEEKDSDKKESSGKRHHHKKKRKHSKEDSEDHHRSKSRKDKKERKEKRQPVIVTEDGSFGGIKFKIKLNATKEEKQESKKQRRPSEFMSSDDEVPLMHLRRRSSMAADGDETDTESNLVIATGDDQDERPSRSEHASGLNYPAHLPRRQKELFMRIQNQQHNRIAESVKDVEEASNRSGSQGDRTPTPEPADQNWYSSDDDGDETKPLPKVESSKVEEPKTDLPNPLNFYTAPRAFQESGLNPPASEPSAAAPAPAPEFAALKNLSEINITELLSSIRQITGQKSQSSPSTTEGDQRERDPRARDPRLGNQGTSSPKTAGDNKPRRVSHEEKPFCQSIYNTKVALGGEVWNNSDSRFQSNHDQLDSADFKDVDLRMLGDGPLPPLKLGLPFKPAPLHSAATEIEASLASHPIMEYKVKEVQIPTPDFSNIKISQTDPMVKKDPRLRRLFRVSSTEESKPDEIKKPVVPADPRRKAQQAADTPKSPETPFSPPQDQQGPRAAPALTPNLLALVQLGLSAAAGGAAFDPRLRGMVPQDIDAIRNAFTSLKPEDLEAIRALEASSMAAPDRVPGQGLLPTPPGLPIIPGPPPNFMMNQMMEAMMTGPMGPMGPMGMPGPMPGPPMGPFGGFGDHPGGDADMRMFRGGFKGDRRGGGGRGNWRGGQRDRNWDNRNRNRERDNRNRSRDKDDRRDKRSQSPQD